MEIASGCTAIALFTPGETRSGTTSTAADCVQLEPFLTHKYDKQGHYLRFVSRGRQDQDVGIVFETDGRPVTTFRVGTVEAVGLVERCG